MPAFAWLEIPDFAVRICRRMVIWNFQVSVSNSTAYPFKRHSRFICGWDSGIFLRSYLQSVDFLFLIGQEEDLVEFLLDGSNAARIPAGDDILDLLWKVQLLFLIDLVVLDDVDCDIVVDEARMSRSSASIGHSTFKISFLPILLLFAFLIIATVQSSSSSFRSW